MKEEGQGPERIRHQRNYAAATSQQPWQIEDGVRAHTTIQKLLKKNKINPLLSGISVDLDPIEKV